MERTFGWRHFRAVQKQGQGKATLVLLQATCEENTQFWVGATRRGWVGELGRQAGWVVGCTASRAPASLPGGSPLAWPQVNMCLTAGRRCLPACLPLAQELPAVCCCPCPPQVNMQNLKDRARWASGWLQKREIQALEAQRTPEAAGEAGGGGAAAKGGGGGTTCKGCAGSGSVPCPLCSQAGQVVEL